MVSSTSEGVSLYSRQNARDSARGRAHWGQGKSGDERTARASEQKRTSKRGGTTCFSFIQSTVAYSGWQGTPSAKVLVFPDSSDRVSVNKRVRHVDDWLASNRPQPASTEATKHAAPSEGDGTVSVVLQARPPTCLRKQFSWVAAQPVLLGWSPSQFSWESVLLRRGDGLTARDACLT